MAGEGEQILIYSSHQLFLIHKCFINLTHDLKLGLYYNTDGNCFLIESTQLQYEAAHVGCARDICRVSCVFSMIAIFRTELISTFIFHQICLQSYATSTPCESHLSPVCLPHFSLLPPSILWPFPSVNTALHRVTNKHESIL